jgi:hypothetical protein
MTNTQEIQAQQAAVLQTNISKICRDYIGQ